jgi:hypothetical protein
VSENINNNPSESSNVKVLQILNRIQSKEYDGYSNLHPEAQIRKHQNRKLKSGSN